MASECSKALSLETCKFLASTWLQQQDLRDKSAVEVADMYCSALSQIWEKYAPPRKQPTSRRVVSPGIQGEDW